jgi:hypothetical protein
MRLSAAKERSFWPQYLFHTTHVTNAVKIVADGKLRARTKASGFHDVANQGALAAFGGSHDYARLYFRPKNPFHLRTEGIKCLADPYRLPNHMSVPVCFVFHFAEVITRPDARFSSGNVQRSHDFLTGDREFDKLDFNAIYHDSWTDSTNGEYIRNCRMAEVAVLEGLPLEKSLYSIIFRTKWDIETFRYLLSQSEVKCPYRLGIEQVPRSLFMSEGLYLADLSFRDDKLAMTFHFPLRNSPADKEYEIYAIQECPAGARLLDKKLQLDKPTLSITGYHAQPRSVWTIRLEKELAFQGMLQHARSEVFS